MTYFVDKWVAITGAAHGIGKELSIQLAESGARLLLSDIDIQALEDLASTLRNEHVDLHISIKKCFLFLDSIL